MSEHPMTETGQAVQRLASALQSFSQSVKAASDAFEAVMPKLRELDRLRAGCAMAETENTELRRQSDTMRREVALAKGIARIPAGALALKFRVTSPGDSSVGIRPINETIHVIVESGDPGGEAGEFGEILRDALVGFFGDATVVEE